MYKLNLRGYIIAVIGRALVVVAGYIGSIPLMLAFTALAALGQGPWQGDMNAVIASCSEYTYLTQGKRVDGTMYSCTSLGVKIGGGIGTAVVGWLLELSGYKGTMAVQPQSALDILYGMEFSRRYEENIALNSRYEKSGKNLLWRFSEKESD